LLSSCSSFRDSHYGGPVMADQNDAAMSLPPQHFFEDFPPNGLFIKNITNKSSNLYLILLLIILLTFNILSIFNIIQIVFPS